MTDSKKKFRLATIDSIIDGKINATLSIEARGRPARGQYIVVPTDNETILGRTKEVDLTNPIHENDTFAPFIMTHGSVPHWSAEVDIERAKIEILVVIDQDGNKSPLTCNPSSGTPVYIADNDDLSPFRNERIHAVALGFVPDSNGEIPATIINKHFGIGDGGYGEARHSAVLGQSGSGKTILAKMLLSATLGAHYDRMGCLIPDTQGDLSDPTSDIKEDFQFDYFEVLRAAGVELEIIKIDDLRLRSKAVLIHQLKEPIESALGGIKPEKAREIAQKVADQLCGKYDTIKVDQISTEAVLQAMSDNVRSCYATKSTREEKAADIEDLRTSDHRRASFDCRLDRVRMFFDGRHEVKKMITDILRRNRKVVIRMDKSTSLSNNEQAYVMREVINEITLQARIMYAEKESLDDIPNALVVLDEAARWIPQTEPEGDDTRAIARKIKQAFFETRKYGIGWMIISQTPAGIQKDALRQCHQVFCGRGLGMGADGKHLEDMLTKDGRDTYDRLDTRGGYFFVGAGLCNNLGSGSQHFAIEALGGNATEKFIRLNRHIFKKGDAW